METLLLTLPRCLLRPHCPARGCRWLGLLLALLVAVPSCAGGDGTGASVAQRAPCLQEESLVLQGEGPGAPRLSSCMLQCAARAMLEMAGAQSTLSLKLNEGREGEEHEFCWMLHLRCEKGERLTKAFVLLNLEQPLEQGEQQLPPPPPPYRLLLTAPPSLRQQVRACQGSRATGLLRGEACGIRFDVTKPFRSAEGGRGAQMCVKAICPERDVCGALRLALRCPPFLATLWHSLPLPDG
ncbi:uncharacterized protein LOC128337098 [Hemicordylus capensis]|uniref:uncharacterized protein LOC128337098 n=1 Tax=Hemicordylus capensis TaxID=884348 RepID=UPI0023039C16|nr:uncharacterized protein LOC128337098 [Hemicordylus capensis]